MATKKAYAKKTSSKKATAKKPPKAELSSNSLKLNLPLDATKAAAIKRCIDNGQLSITLSRVDLVGARLRLGDPYKYD